MVTSNEYRLIAVWISGQLKWLVPGAPTMAQCTVVHNGIAQVVA